MFFDEKLYTPNNYDDEIFLTDFPIEIIENSIKSQFNNPFDFSKRDYLQTFFAQYEYSINNCNEIEMESLEEYHDQFIQFILKIFNDKLGISIPYIEDKVDSELHETIHIIYRFFILNIKHNFVNYVYNYIKEHKEEIKIKYEDDKRKDVSTSSFKEEINNEYDVIILVNLPDIVNDIINDVLPAGEFLRLCVDDKPCLETSFVRDKFENYIITGNFSDMYVNMLGEDEKSEIVSAVRSRILSDYPSRYAVIDEYIDNDSENE